MKVNLNTSYPTAEAERGKFAAIDTSTITSYPSAGRGRYALLTHDVGGGNNTSSVQMTGGTITTSKLTIEFSPTISLLEVYNNSSNILYVSTDTTVSIGNLTTYGMVVPANTLYTLQKSSLSGIAIAASASSNARIHGHS